MDQSNQLSKVIPKDLIGVCVCNIIVNMEVRGGGGK